MENYTCCKIAVVTAVLVEGVGIYQTPRTYIQELLKDLVKQDITAWMVSRQHAPLALLERLLRSEVIIAPACALRGFIVQ